MARLYVLSGPDLGKSFEVAPGATLGRATDCAAVMRDHSVSRQHARIECHDDQWSIVDLDSRNGLVVNGKKTKHAELPDGIEFQVGEVLVRFRSVVSELPPAPKPKPLPTPVVDPPPMEDEIVLEGALEEAPPAPKPMPSFPKPASPAPELVRTTRTKGPVAGLEQRERGILQYSKVENRGGFFESDLSQQPWYLKIGVWLLALVLFALVGWAAFRATSFFKQKVAGPDADTAPAQER
jgi:hypothetical protein